MGAVTDVYLRTRKVPDLAWNTYVARPPAAALVHAFRNTGVTPNQITLASLVVALISATLLVSLPGHLGLLAAVLVFQLSYVLDCADGMLARLRGVQSPSGHLLDFLMDEVKAFVILAAASIRLYLEQQRVGWLLLGMLGLVCLATGVAITTFQRRPEITAVLGDTPAGGSPGSLVAAIEYIAKYLLHYPSYILHAALLGRTEAYVLPYVIVNVAYSLRATAWIALRFAR
jgi:hypothetical protein